MSVQPELAPIMPLEAERHLAVVQQDTPLTVTSFPMELKREDMIKDLLQDSCEDCEPKRKAKAHQLAFFSGRISISSAVLLIEEKLGCTHLDD